MKPSILAFAVSAAIAGLAQPAFAQDAGLTPAPVPADTTQQQAPAAGDKAKLQQPVLMPKPVPKRPPTDGTLVAGGILGGLAVIGLAAGGGGGGGNDQPSSP